LFDLFVNGQFEFGKHRLAEKRAADRFQAFAQIIELFLFAARILDHVIVQQHFAADRSGFCDEGGIIRLLPRLVGGGKKRVHRMAPLMRKGGERIVIVIVIEQEIGMHVIGPAAHIGARGLALARQGVGPIL
jgi:hypothetical protein